jgi:hypothetical protein
MSFAGCFIRHPIAHCVNSFLAIAVLRVVNAELSEFSPPTVHMNG